MVDTQEMCVQVIGYLVETISQSDTIAPPVDAPSRPQWPVSRFLPPVIDLLPDFFIGGEDAGELAGADAAGGGRRAGAPVGFLQRVEEDGDDQVVAGGIGANRQPLAAAALVEPGAAAFTGQGKDQAQAQAPQGQGAVALSIAVVLATGGDSSGAVAQAHSGGVALDVLAAGTASAIGLLVTGSKEGGVVDGVGRLAAHGNCNT